MSDDKDALRSKRAAYMREFMAKMRAEGTCTACTACPALTGKRKCQACYDKWNAQRKARRANNKATGLCTECDLPALPGHVRCQACFDSNRAVTRGRVARLKAEGLCIRCGKVKTFGDKQHCPTCFLKVTAHSVWRDQHRWTDLKAIFDRQGGVCPYTGKALTLGLDASIDHITPTARGGTNDLDNLQWVLYDVNLMKLDHLHHEFLELVRTIADKHRAENHSLSA